MFLRVCGIFGGPIAGIERRRLNHNYIFTRNIIRWGGGGEIFCGAVSSANYGMIIQQTKLIGIHLERLAKTSGADGVMICGDFNMTPDSALYHYMVAGAIDMDGLNR